MKLDRLLPSLRRVRPPPAILLLSVAACTFWDDGNPSTVSGELSQGTFQYECDSSTRACSRGVAQVFPTRVAVDTRFGLSFAPYTGTVNLDALEPASTDLLEVRDYAWRALKPGTVGLMSRPALGDLQDYTFVKLENAASVRFFVGTDAQRDPGSQASGSTTSSVRWEALVESLGLYAGSGVPLVAEPSGTDGAALAGEPRIDFACEDPAIVALDRPTQRPRYFALVGTAAGTTRCTLGALGVSLHFDVTVTDDPDDPDPDAGTHPPSDAGSDGPSDAGTETDAENVQ